MITKIILRLSLFIGVMSAMICVVAVLIGTTIPTTRIVGYLTYLRDENRSFGVADINRRLYVVQSAPFETDWQVIFSPNGQLALVTDDDGAQTEFFALNLATYALSSFPLDYDLCAPPRDTIRWSPDSHHVTFHCSPNTTSTELNGLHLWDIQNNSVTRLYEPTTLGLVQYTWSPDGQYVSLIDNGAVVIINIPTRQFSRPSITLEYSAMRWSPSGDKLALTAENQLLIYDVSARTTTPILSDIQAGVGYWSPSGEWIATIAQQGSFSSIYTWDFAKNQAYRIGTERYPINTAVDLRWSGDGDWLLIQTDVNQADRFAPIYVASRDGTQGYQVIFDGRNPRWVGDSPMMTYQVNRTERLRYGRDVVMVNLADILAQTDYPQVLALDVFSYVWLEDKTLLTWQSIDRYGRIRALNAHPSRGRAGWSLFPASYSVYQFAVWR